MEGNTGGISVESRIPAGTEDRARTAAGRGVSATISFQASTGSEPNQRTTETQAWSKAEVNGGQQSAVSKEDATLSETSLLIADSRRLLKEDNT